jgi:ATP-dependent RNA helicase RhlE
VRTRLGASRLASQLVRDGIDATAIHSDRTQQERMDALAGFKEGKIRVLVATDIAARGLDIDQLPCVINYELPHTPEDYVHRIGRTGRAGQSGEAISLVSDAENEYLERIERLLKSKIAEHTLEGFDPSAREAPRPHRRVREDAPTAAPRAAPRAREPRPAPAPKDPLFSQPYEQSPSAASAPPPVTAPPKPGQRRQIAALFLPPAPAEQES